MDLTRRVSNFVGFLRGGYPTWMPVTGYVPLVALSRRRPSDDEINTLTSELIAHRSWPITTADIGVAITRITQDMPSLDDIDRVRCRLDAIRCSPGS
ncbi:hypothetical protein MSIMFB_03167 [Mycobacterium simulans]|uniref:DUF3349 domain-containing protein n=1 Tax=Mycobacterium simulans TaxID=627089 RepID=A0A7Z7ILB1_9MYCO|nr:DUF3349 domain-containing protein [Mycobacterium simulans]SOJ55685.1 hypothetical protein MSIMFB_03167 [Mycobacterium simulans]SON61860.1 hypothetical protein MSIMFI_03379 [Mycobacterium simulans]